MESLQFEWDDRKARHNLAAHGVSFEFATGVFGDPLAIELLDDREVYGEERWIILGLSAGALLVVAYTERAGRIRLISARQATREEHDAYFAENG